ncbi:MAG: HIT domain-containing protein [Candidatus Nanoarchaeia archaeon]|nr:HIT domain-containing protein [Candidatus Nanoarchaeia archaeon]
MSENPLTPKQIKTLNDISKLPAEEQRIKLQEFAKTLSPEQLAFLQEKQQGCIFCSVAEGKIEAKKLYEDDKVIALLDIRPATRGHALVIPKKHYVVTGQMSDDEVAHIFKIANKVASLLFDELKCAGTNIIVLNGPGSGQRISHVAVYVIPRYEDDGLDFLWKADEVGAEHLDEMYKQLKGKIKFEKKEKIEKKAKVEVVKDDEEERLP